MTTTWTIAIDWDRNGNYSDTYDDVSSRVIEAQWFLGMRKPFQEVADDSKLELVLDNSDQRFSSDNYASPLYGKLTPFKPVRIQSNDGTTRTHWVGWIESFQPIAGRYGKRTIKILANGAMQFFKAAETKIELQENKRTDEIIALLIKEVVVPPALTGAWILGRVGYSELGVKDGDDYVSGTTWLANTTAYSQLDAGRQTLDLAADNWVRQGGMSDAKQNTFDVYRAINDITAAERGRFLFDREGKALFWNRHHLLDKDPVAATLDNTMQDMEYVFAGVDDVKNEVIVTCHPRTISADSNQVLWKLNDKIRIEANETYEMFVKYEDDSKNRVGGRNVTYTDLGFEAGSAALTLEAKANGANLKFTNTTNKAAIVNTLTIQGQKIVDSGQMEAKATDNASIIDFGRRTLKLNLPSVASLEEAQSIADHEVRRRAWPRGFIQNIKLVSHATQGGGQHAQQLARTIGDLVLVSETQAGFSTQRYFIIGEAHKLTKGGDLYETTWYLEPAPTYSATSVTATQPSDLLAYWKFADISGTVLSDSSGSSNRNGVISGALWGQPGIGDGLRAARFDGVNDYANPYSSSFNGVWNGQEFTISGWFKVADSSVWTDGQTLYIFSFCNGDTPVDSIALRKDSSNNQLTCEYSANGTTKSVTVSSYSPIDWVHFAVTVSYSGDAMKFYLDGVQQGNTQNGLGQWNNGQALQTDIAIGAQNPSTNFWKGDLAHVAVWDRVLTVGEIISLKPVFPWRLGIPGRSELSAATLLTY